MAISEGRDFVVVDSDLRTLVPQFLSSKRKDIANAIRALERGDCDSAARTGHQLKGEGSSFGFDQVTAMGAELELAAIRGDRSVALKWARSLAEFLDHIEVRFPD